MKTGHSRMWVAGLVLSLVAVAGFFLLRDDGAQIIPPFVPAGDARSRSGEATSAREDAAANLLGRLQSGLATGARRDVVALSEPGSKEAAAAIGAIFDNTRELGLTDVSLRYVDENEAQLSGTDWVADVQISWRIAGFDRAPSRMEVPFTFAPDGSAFVSVGNDPEGAVPLWLLDDVAVERSPRALVMVADKSRVDEFSVLADRAVADVKQVLPRWRGKLVVEVPGSQVDLERMLGADDNAYQSIAAVTSIVDGSLNLSSPTHILVNPTVFEKLSNEGAQIVVSHEATHVATSAATSTMPMWLLEGFADYVALAHVDLPVSTTASQILAKVRRSGPPRHLPGAVEFDPENKVLGTSYEAAWLACRLIGKTYGERRLVGFYDAMDGGLPPGAAFRRFLDTDQRGFTVQWQEYLRRLSKAGG